MLENRNNAFHRALKAGESPEAIVNRIYLRALSWRPTETERMASLACIASHEDKSLALEDVCWAVINKDEFLFQH